MAAPVPLVLASGQPLQKPACGLLYEPAEHEMHVTPDGLYVPPTHAAHARLSPVPEAANPDKHEHVVAPVLLVLPSGHVAHETLALTALYVPGWQATHWRLAPELTVEKPA